MVIFIFLRTSGHRYSGRHRPAVAGRYLAVLYQLGYSLDNLSLMALSIAVGFVSTTRRRDREHRAAHGGRRLPFEASLKVPARSASPSFDHAIADRRVHSAVPDGGYVGLLFREFAITVSVALVLSLLISLTLKPMMCARLLKPESRGTDGSPVFRTWLRWPAHLYEAGLKIVAAPSLITLMTMLGTIALTGYLYVLIPKGFFPQQDTD